MTFSEYEKLLKDDPSRKEVEFYAYPKVAYVFNAAQVEGLQLLPQPDRPPLEENKLAEEVIKTMAENMEVRMIYGGDEAFYRPATDTVHLPPQDAFFTVNDWTSTALHELAHATSAPSRLDRPVVGYYQDPESYAMYSAVTENLPPKKGLNSGKTLSRMLVSSTSCLECCRTKESLNLVSDL